MTHTELLEKYNLKFDESIEELLFFASLDTLYLHLTPEAAKQFIADFMANADEIYNEINETIKKNIEELANQLSDENKNLA